MIFGFYKQHINIVLLTVYVNSDKYILLDFSMFYDIYNISSLDYSEEASGNLFRIQFLQNVEIKFVESCNRLEFLFTSILNSLLI